MLMKHNLPNMLCTYSRAGTKYVTCGEIVDYRSSKIYTLWQEPEVSSRIQHSCQPTRNICRMPWHSPSYSPDASNCSLLSSGRLDTNMFHQILELVTFSVLGAESFLRS